MVHFPGCFDAATSIGYLPVREAGMRKSVVMALAVLALSAATGAALDIAIAAGYQYQFGLTTDFNGIQPQQAHAISLDLRAWPYPLQLGIGISRVIIGPTTGSYSFGNGILTADYWLLDFPLGSLPLSMHVGAGVWAAVPVFGLGIRGPFGLRWTPMPGDRGFELCLEIVPSVGAWMVPLPLFGSMTLTTGASAGLGIRYWFGR
jgi:hypothetical protein